MKRTQRHLRDGFGTLVARAARPGEQVDLDEIRKTVRDQKGAHQTPKSIHMVGELPKTPAGKIDKKALRRPYWGEGTRQIH